LLHLWSLAIEEQFYLVFPMVFFALSKLKSRWLLPSFVILCIAGFVAAIVTAQLAPDWAYYSLWSRGFAILTGCALAAYQYTKANTTLTKDWSTVASILGLLLIAISFVFINSGMLYPGFASLPSILGTALVILAGQTALPNHHFLGKKWMVYFGKLSYPLYLWHWPLLVFSWVKFGNHADHNGLVLFISVLLAAATYSLIEKPIQQSSAQLAKTTVLIMSMFTVAFIAFRTYEYSIYLGDENIAQVDVDHNDWNKIFLDEDKGYNNPQSKNKVLFFGDSQALDLYLSAKHSNQFGVSIIKSPSVCSAFKYTRRGQGKFLESCQLKFKKLLESKELLSANVFIYSRLWNEEDDYYDGYLEGIQQLRKLNPNMRIIFAGPKPKIWHSHASIEAIMKDYTGGDINVYLNHSRVDLSASKNSLRSLTQDLGVEFLDVESMLCKSDCTFYSNKKFHYFDETHWTLDGMRFFAPIVESTLLKALPAAN